MTWKSRRSAGNSMSGMYIDPDADDAISYQPQTNASTTRDQRRTCWGPHRAACQRPSWQPEWLEQQQPARYPAPCWQNAHSNWWPHSACQETGTGKNLYKITHTVLSGELNLHSINQSINQWIDQSTDGRSFIGSLACPPRLIFWQTLKQPDPSKRTTLNRCS